MLNQKIITQNSILNVKQYIFYDFDNESEIIRQSIVPRYKNFIYHLKNN